MPSSAVRQRKESEVQKLSERFERSSLVILTDHRGLRVADLTNLRSRLRPVGVEFVVAKNTLTRFAVQGLGRGAISADLEGPTALAFAYRDPAVAVKTIQDFIRQTRSVLKIKGGLLGDRRLAVEDVARLAELPGKSELQGQLVGTLASPMSSMVGVMNAVLSNLAYVLEARVRQLDGGAEATAG